MRPSADRSAKPPLRIPQYIFLLMLLAQRCTWLWIRNTLSSLLIAWIIELTVNWFAYWKDTNIYLHKWPNKPRTQSLIGGWSGTFFHISGLLHVFVTVTQSTGCSITHSTTTACLLVLCCWVTLICAFPLRSRSTADHCTVRGCLETKNHVEALAISLLSLRSFCRVYCWVSS